MISLVMPAPAPPLSTWSWQWSGLWYWVTLWADIHIVAAWDRSCIQSSISGGKALHILARAGRVGTNNCSLSLAANTPSRVQTAFTASLAVERELGMAQTTDRWEIRSTANTC